MALIPQRARRFAAGALLLGSATAHAATPEDARRAYDAGNYSDAMGMWAELNQQGSAEAAFGLGLLFDLGNGTPEDPRVAFLWYTKAAEAGLPAAEFNVAAMYDRGRGVARSSERAALWYAKAAAHGHHRAQYVLGLLYQEGEGVPRNPDVAAAWFRAASEGGLAAAATRLKSLTAVARPDGEMAAVTLASPLRNETVTIAENNPAVELVWVAPPTPQPVRYLVHVRQIGDSAVETVFTGSVSETAVLVRLPADAGFYAWNVDTIRRDGTRAAGDWNWFSTDHPAKPAQSMASAPGTPNRDR